MIGNIVGAVVVIGIGAFVVAQMASKGQFAAELWKPLIEARSWQYYFLPGLQNTLIAAAYSIVLAMVFGLLFGVGRLASNRVVRWFCGAVVEFFRAVPVLIMMFALYAMLPRLGLTTPETNPLIAVVIGLTLYNGSVIAELVRSGVYGLPKGQREAGLAIGMTRGKSIRFIELPQALIAMLPSLVSQFVVILKDSALGALITYTELLRAARLLGSDAPFPILQTLFMAAVIFIVLNFILSRIAELVARRVGGRTSGRARANPAPPNAVTVPAVGGTK
ncbi:amino acid ABC transporter permease [Occultella glacieicola]|uniref:Amino acid ABC transporter permease n=2 Tax=Occultella glacieicola TaxID=2518684 RepID=A0ABY2E2M2_9MICO|nr:amino acid ABC transporter permease [Occultella glacieicola]